ncbi:MAG: DUF1848 domain-containing protein [Dongiaceae bacterium]
MIVSASYRTDIPAFYGPWFRARLAAGFCLTANPYGGPPATVSLRPGDVEGFVFWTRNAGSFLDDLAEVGRRGIPFIVQMTVSGYPRALDASTIATGQAIPQFKEIAKRFGSAVPVWRYDPILVSSLTGGAWHEENFVRIAGELRGSTDEVVVSFTQFYAKTNLNLAKAAAAHGFARRDPGAAEKRALLQRLAAIAAENGMALTVCTQPELAGNGIEAARCIDGRRLSRIANSEIAAKEKGNRPGCLCAESRDIGAYDSCVQGCAYCYAVRSPAAALERRRRHDPAGEMLIPPARAAVTDRG